MVRGESMRPGLADGDRLLVRWGARVRPGAVVGAPLAPRTQAVLVERVGLRPGVTPGVRVGGWLALLLPLLTALGLGLRALTYRRSQRPDSRDDVRGATHPTFLFHTKEFRHATWLQRCW